MNFELTKWTLIVSMQLSGLLTVPTTTFSLSAQLQPKPGCTLLPAMTYPKLFREKGRCGGQLTTLTQKTDFKWTSKLLPWPYQSFWHCLPHGIKSGFSFSFSLALFKPFSTLVCPHQVATCWGWQRHCPSAFALLCKRSSSAVPWEHLLA